MKALLCVLTIVVMTTNLLANDSVEIVVPENSCPVVKFAGKELQYFLTRALGADVKIAKIPNEQMTSIILGKQLLEKAGIDLNSFGRDEYVIKSFGNNIYIAGKDDLRKDPAVTLKNGNWQQLYERGTLFGVYSFLEKFVGVRFYFPGEIGTIVPKVKKLDLSSIYIRKKPDYTARNFCSFYGITPDGKNGKESYPFKNINYYRLKLQTLYLPNCHGLSRLGYIRRFAKTHPEYFALYSDGKRDNNPSHKHSGQLCLSSRVKDQVYQDAKAFLTGKSAKEAGILTDRFGYVWDPSGFQPGYFNIMPQDGFYECKCSECQKHYSKGREETSKYIWNFFIDIAERLKKDKIPGFLTTMSYPPYDLLPDRKVPSNLLVMIQERGPWSMSQKIIIRREQDKIKSWVKKLEQKVWLWNYANKYGSLNIPGVPTMTPVCIGKYYKMNSPYIFGAFLESEVDYYIFNYLNYYVFSKLCWDNSIDVNSLLKEHYQLMFGPAADTIEEVFQVFEHKWFKIMGKLVDSKWGPTTKPVSEYVLWNQIYSAKELEYLGKAFTQAEKMCEKHPDNLKRVKFMRKHFLDRLINQRKEYLKGKDQCKNLTFYTALPKRKIIIDGKLNDPAWKVAEQVYLIPFSKTDSNKTVRTIVKTLCDDKNLYISYYCEEPFLSKMQTRRREKDDMDIYKDSCVEFFIKPDKKKQKYYQFIINASGSFTDIMHKADGSNKSACWNSNARIVVKKITKAWIVEISIPLKDIEITKKQALLVNFNRTRMLKRTPNNYIKLYTWSRFLQGNFHDTENFGYLVFSKIKDNNLIKNGTFTSKTEGLNIGGWFASPISKMQSGSSWQLDPTTFIKGGKSFMIKAINSEGRIKIMQPLKPLKPNTEYMLSYFVKTKSVKADNRKGGGVCANIWITKNYWYPRNRLTGTMSWTQMSFKFKTPANIKKQRPAIMLWLMFASGTVWFDDVRLLEVSEKVNNIRN